MVVVAATFRVFGPAAPGNRADEEADARLEPTLTRP